MLINIALKSDPTRTLTLRRRFVADMKRRFKKLRKDIYTSIVTNDCFGLEEQPHTISTLEAIPQKQFAFLRDPQKINAFMEWLQEQINAGILEIHTGAQIGRAVEEAWTNMYIQTAYQKGIIRARQELEKAGYQVPPVDDPFQGIQTSFNQPFHIDRLGVMYTRTFRGLKGITDEMDKQISGILSQGIAEGRSPRELARLINDRVDKIGIVRADILARTEVIRAHHVANIQEYKNWGVEGVKVLAEWATAGDHRVCDLCNAMAGKNNGFGEGIYTLGQIEGLIPRHPRCRCMALPLDITDNAELQKKLAEIEGESP